MRSIISEYLITTMNDKLEQSFDLLEKEIFYTQSKNTHINAKEQYVNLLQRLECKFMTNETSQRIILIYGRILQIYNWTVL